MFSYVLSGRGLDVCVCVCVVCVCALFGPVKPESGIIPSGEKIIQLWTFKFSW